LNIIILVVLLVVVIPRDGCIEVVTGSLHAPEVKPISTFFVEPRVLLLPEFILLEHVLFTHRLSCMSQGFIEVINRDEWNRVGVIHRKPILFLLFTLDVGHNALTDSYFASLLAHFSQIST